MHSKNTLVETWRIIGKETEYKRKVDTIFDRINMPEIKGRSDCWEIRHGLLLMQGSMVIIISKVS